MKHVRLTVQVVVPEERLHGALAALLRYGARLAAQIHEAGLTAQMPALAVQEVKANGEPVLNLPSQ